MHQHNEQVRSSDVTLVDFRNVSVIQYVNGASLFAVKAREDKYRRSEFSLGNSASDLGLYLH
ncbi:hypothetical protein OUZ56_019176 [Daphnia magna]|uniref:Uncharacterized protein n=1 Tax=Daphnia magna TaxID=35525 RepID=A0ABQ9ZAU2_9CRUS|nr:hypothetical protein OUZ56_019172 [Daphnia magna]KAK4010030.1 hypothetical protein OUZ56_019176 [Daphnia magna]